MRKLLNIGCLGVLLLLLTACQEEVVSGVIVDNITLTANSSSVATGDYAELTIAADFQVIKVIANRAGDVSSQAASVKETFDLAVKLGVCVLNDNKCEINTELSTDITLPPSLALEDGSTGAFFGTETFIFSERVKTLSHTVKLTAKEKGSYSFQPFVVLADTLRTPDETVEITFE